MIGRVVYNLAILPENCYNIDETGVILSMLGSIKVFISKDDLCNYRDVEVKRIMVTTIKCVSANSRSLLSLIIWLALTY